MPSLAAPAFPTRPTWPAVVSGLLRPYRAQAVGQVVGSVLDLGDATANLMHYAAHGVRRLTAVEPDPARAEALVVNAAAKGMEVTTISHPVSAQASSFDAVVSVLGLATYADLPAVLAAVARVIDEGGRLHFVEPVLRPGAAALLATSADQRTGGAGSRHLNRDVASAVRAAGLEILAIERFTMPTLVPSLRHFGAATARLEGDR